MQFWKPGTLNPGSSLDRASQDEDSVLQSSPYSVRESLPIRKHSTVNVEVRNHRPGLLVLTICQDLVMFVGT